MRKPKLKVRHPAFMAGIYTNVHGHIAWAGVRTVCLSAYFPHSATYRVELPDGSVSEIPASSLHVDKKDALDCLGKMVDEHFSRPKMDDPMF